MNTNRMGILTVDGSNLESAGFFCYKSKRKTEGYTRKLAWMHARLSEGLRMQILFENGVSKGFIEYIPGEFAWRAVQAQGYLFIHCLWVVGRAKGKGYGTRLLEKCIQDAREDGFYGVAVLASGRSWLADADLYLKSGFQVVDRTPPGFSLLALDFGSHPPPRLPDNWDTRRHAWGPELIVVHADQCPYIDRMKQAVFNVAAELNLPAQEIQLQDAGQVQARAPSPFGVYSILYRGELISARLVGSDELRIRLQSRLKQLRLDIE